MLDLIAFIYALLVAGSSCWIYRRHSLKPRYRPLKEAGLLWKPTGFHSIQGMARNKRDPLRRLQIELAVYGMVHMGAVVALWFAGFAVIGCLEDVGWN